MIRIIKNIIKLQKLDNSDRIWDAVIIQTNPSYPHPVKLGYTLAECRISFDILYTKL